MAALTANRFGQIRSHPTPIQTMHELAASNTVIFAHSLVEIDSNGDVLPATSSSAGVIAYSEVYYDEDSENLTADELGSDVEKAKVKHGLTVLLNGVSMAAGDIGKNVYANDDNTVQKSADESTETKPYVGTVQEFISATEVYVYIPGLTRTQTDQSS